MGGGAGRRYEIGKSSSEIFHNLKHSMYNVHTYCGTLEAVKRSLKVLVDISSFFLEHFYIYTFNRKALKWTIFK